MSIYTEKEVIYELLLNLNGFQSKFYHKIDETNERILKEMSEISYRFLSLKETNLLLDLKDSILPKVFYATLELPLVRLMTIQSTTLLKKIFDYFYQIATSLHILRIWCREVRLPSEENQNSFDHIKNEELIVVKTSIDNAMASIEQELSIIELQVLERPSLMEKEVPYYQFHRQGNGSGSHSMTLLKFYQHCTKYEQLLHSLLGLMINFCDNYDLFAPAASSSSKSSHKAHNNPQENKLGNSLSSSLQQSFNQMSFLYHSELILRKSEKLEHYPLKENHHAHPHYPFLHHTNLSTLLHSNEKKEEKEEERKRKEESIHLHMNNDFITFETLTLEKQNLIFQKEQFISKAIHGNMLTFQYFPLFIKQLIIQFIQSLTKQIMKNIWLMNQNQQQISRKLLKNVNTTTTTTTTTIQMNNPNQNSLLTLLFQNQQILVPLYDINIFLELLPSSSIFYELFQQIQYSTEDCEVIHKIPMNAISMKKQKKIKKTTTSTKAISKTALSRNEFLDFIAKQSEIFLKFILLPKSTDPAFQLIFQNNTNHNSSSERSGEIVTQFKQRLLDPLEFIYQKKCLDFYLKFHSLSNLQFYFYYFYGNSSPLFNHSSSSKSNQWENLEFEQKELEIFQKYLNDYLLDTSQLVADEKQNKKKNTKKMMKDHNNNKEDEESFSTQQFLNTSHQLNQNIFTTENLTFLSSMISSATSSASNEVTKKKSSNRIDAAKTITTTSVVTNEFIPFQKKCEKYFLEPFHSELLTIQHYSFQLIDANYSLMKHFYFMKNLFLFGKNNHYDSLKELCHFYVYFPPKSSTSSSSSSSWISSSYTSANRNLSYYDNEFFSEEFHLLNNLKSSITLMIEDDLPKRGIQSYYFHFPLVTDFFQQHYQQLYTQSSSRIPPTTTTKDTTGSKKGGFSHIFLTIIKELRYEIFYAWPLSSIFHQSFITSLHDIHSYLLSLQIMKWFGEFYWKSIISSNSMNIEYNFNHQMIQEKKKQSMNSTKKNTEGIKKKSGVSGIDRVPSNDGDDEGDINLEKEKEKEKEIEQTATIMKEIIHIYDIERDIYFSKRQIQLQLIYLISLIKSLYDYTLTYIHEFLWKELESKLFSSSSSASTKNKWRQTEQQPHQRQGGGGGERKVTVVMIRYYLEEMISSIQSFLAIFQENITILLPKILQCFHELHVTLLFENVYRLQQEDLEKAAKKKTTNPTSTNPTHNSTDTTIKTQQIISKNERLIKFRQLEILFEDMKKQMKDIYSIIREHANPRRYYRKSNSSLMNRSGILQEHQKKVSLYQMKLFEEMNQRLNY